MDRQRDFNEKIIRVLNCENKDYFQIIPERRKPLEIKTQDVNYNMEDYVQYDNNVNILTANKIALNEAEKPPENNI